MNSVVKFSDVMTTFDYLVLTLYKAKGGYLCRSADVLRLVSVPLVAFALILFKKACQGTAFGYRFLKNARHGFDTPGTVCQIINSENLALCA